MSLPPPPYQVGLDQMYAYTGGTVPTSQMHPVCWNHPLIEYDQKKRAIHTIHEGRIPNSISQTLKISMPT